ncbi:putative nuclear RNA export factor SDE5 [Neltuma alba]|uniref:putative nuclear RNA export factor SDE5 n=1 Tax=Neltuma alba TaxID=207710 RepID=UPI0010A374F8|nr:putative nuclear RNA export factor SDE5 [Prosopis alba]
MIEYHKAAVEAFVNGDRDKAKKLLDQGQVYLTKAREADEESSKMIVETKNEESQALVLDLHEFSSGQAIRLLKCHLSTLSGPSFEYLKVIIYESNQDVSQGPQCQKRKRRITALLQNESIEWNEGETSGTLLIRLDKIDPKRLSFHQK